MLVCSDYSSVLLESHDGLLVGSIQFFILYAFPKIIEYIGCFRKECIQYKISHSPMSVSSVFHTIFIEGHGPVMSFGRRLVIAAIIFVTVLPRELDLDMYILVCLWGLLFVFFSVYHFDHDLTNYYSQAKSDKRLIFLMCCGNLTKLIAFPFNLKFWWNEVKRTKFFRKYFKLDLNNGTSNATRNQHVATSHGPTGHTRLLPRTNEPQQVITCQVVNICKYCLSIVILLMLYLTVIFPVSFFFGLGIMMCRHCFMMTSFVARPIDSVKKKIIFLWEMALGLITLLILILSCINCFQLVFFFVAGLYLNGGFYSVYFVPLSIILLYSWSDWRLSVEAKYLELNTKIYKVCKKGITRPVHVTRREGTHGEISDSSTATDSINRFEIKLDENGEPVIPKPLYDIVREKFLPYDKILVPYFEGLIFVILFAYFLHIFMSLAQASGISSGVQIISTMAATLLPFLVNIIWTKNNEKQKEANSLALKYKLKHVLSVCSSNNDTGEIVVEFTGTMPTGPMGTNLEY